MNPELVALCSSHTETAIKGFFGEYRWLSNFHVTPIFFNGILFPSTENAYQAAKCVKLDEMKKFANISCVEAKNLGQNVLLRPDWEKVKLDIMASLTWIKYTGNQELKQKLLDTGNKYLEESNWWNDRFWGIDYKTGKGENNLGKILMNLRSLIRG